MTYCGATIKLRLCFSLPFCRTANISNIVQAELCLYAPFVQIMMTNSNEFVGAGECFLELSYN